MQALKFPAETARLKFRAWTSADLEPYARMNADPEVMEFFPAPMSEEETKAHISRIGQQFHEKGFGLYAVEEKSSGNFIGFIGFSVPRFESFFTPCVEIGWRLRKESWGMGYATEGALACLQFGNGLEGMDRIYSWTAVLNRKSERIMQKIGMKFVTQFDHPLLKADSPLRPHVLYVYESE